MSDRDAGLPYSRQETEAERLDRNYGELLQELRVSQTGVQILFAFLLSSAFQRRFPQLSQVQLDIYLATLISAALAAALLIAPAAIHRILFRHRLKEELVTWSSRMAMGGLTFLLLAILGAVLLIVDFVAGIWAAVALTVLVGLVCIAFWCVLPLWWRAAAHRRPDPD
jgi:hypothetical protein